MISCRRAISDTTAPGAYDSATIRPLSSSLHRRRRPTPLRISTRPRGAVASTIWSTIYANRSCQHRSHLPNYAALRKMGAKHRLHCTASGNVNIRVTKQPEHGSTETTPTINFPTYPKEHSRFKCNDHKVRGVQV